MSPAGEDELLRAVALRNASTILSVRRRAEQELLEAKEELERRTGELARSLALMRATLDAVSEAVLVTDAAGQVTAWNERFIRMWRVPRDTMAAREPQRLAQWMAASLSEPQPFLAMLARVQADGAGCSSELLRMEDGRRVECQSRPQVVDGAAVGRVWIFREG